MDDTALDAVAGGANAEEAWISILSVGICCAIEAINSAKRKDKEWGDGRILCDDC